MRTIPLSGKKAAGRVALVDDEDYELVASHVWRVYEETRVGRRHGPYAFASIRRVDGRRTMIYMHKLLTGWSQTDHKNHDGLDNQRTNLRPVTRAQNQQNARPYAGCTSPYRGVYWNRQRRTWQAQISTDGRRRNLGRFASEEDAARAFDGAALAAWGEYAYLNFAAAAEL